MSDYLVEKMAIEREQKLERAKQRKAQTARIHRRLILMGFDLSEGRRVGCSQCSPCVCNGVALHEDGCPNEMHECHGCGNTVPKNQKYCEECQ